MYNVTITQDNESINIYATNLTEIEVLKSILKRFRAADNVVFTVDAESQGIIIVGDEE